jgi:hypothetical protein
MYGMLRKHATQTFTAEAGGVSLAVLDDRSMKFSLTVPGKAVYIGEVTVSDAADANDVLPLVFTITKKLTTPLATPGIVNACITDWPNVLVWANGAVAALS